MPSFIKSLSLLAFIYQLYAKRDRAYGVGLLALLEAGHPDKAPTVLFSSTIELYPF
jgi:hypothetical protein